MCVLFYSYLIYFLIHILLITISKSSGRSSVFFRRISLAETIVSTRIQTFSFQFFIIISRQVAISVWTCATHMSVTKSLSCTCLLYVYITSFTVYWSIYWPVDKTTDSWLTIANDMVSSFSVSVIYQCISLVHLKSELFQL